MVAMRVTARPILNIVSTTALHHLFWPRVRSGSILLQKSPGSVGPTFSGPCRRPSKKHVGVHSDRSRHQGLPQPRYNAFEQRFLVAAAFASIFDTSIFRLLQQNRPISEVRADPRGGCSLGSIGRGSRLVGSAAGLRSSARTRACSHQSRWPTSVGAGCGGNRTQASGTEARRTSAGGVMSTSTTSSFRPSATGSRSGTSTGRSRRGLAHA
jgi:hypothetical protein